MTSDYNNIALPDDQLFQNYIMKRVVKRSLLKFNMSSGRQYEGFITGLDEEWIQITTRKGLKPLPLQRNLIEAIEDDRIVYTDSELGYTREEQRMIEELSIAVYKKSSEALDTRKRGQHGRRGERLVV